MLLKFSSSTGSRRTIDGKGRWRHIPFTVEYDGGYSLVSGGKSLEEWVIEFVANNPRCSMRAVREGVIGANKDVDSTVRQLLGSGRLRNEGAASAFELVVSDRECALNSNP